MALFRGEGLSEPEFYGILETYAISSAISSHATKRYKQTTTRKRCNQKEISTPKTEVAKDKLTIRYLYLENNPKPRVLQSFIMIHYSVFKLQCGHNFLCKILYLASVRTITPKTCNPE